ncbi:MAG: hypothetical protein Q8J65_04775 [Nitrosomonadales bacterium]|nr:hypothetical protein [Nitrosomonadales bacterium]
MVKNRIIMGFVIYPKFEARVSLSLAKYQALCSDQVSTARSGMAAARR